MRYWISVNHLLVLSIRSGIFKLDIRLPEVALLRRRSALGFETSSRSAEGGGVGGGAAVREAGAGV